MLVITVPIAATYLVWTLQDVCGVLLVLHYLIGITFAKLENVKCQAIEWQS